MAQRPLAFFSEDFDRPAAPVNAPEPDTAPALFTAEEMAASRAVAWAEGHEAASRETAQDDARQLGQSLAAVAEALSSTRAEYLAQAESAAEELARLLSGALAAALPALCAQHGAAEIQAVAAEILPPLIHESHVRVQVAPHRVDALQQQIAALDPELVRIISVMAAPQLGPSDIAIRWQHGEAIRDAGQIWNNIRNILAPHGLSPDEAQTAPMEKEPAHAE